VTRSKQQLWRSMLTRPEVHLLLRDRARLRQLGLELVEDHLQI